MTEISVTVKTGSRKERVEKNLSGVGKPTYHVWVKARPERGRANKEVCRLLGEHFAVPPSSVFIVAGGTSKTKRVRIG